MHTAVLAGDDPVIMLTAPIPATAKALARPGLAIDDIGAFEVNEAFAPVPLAWLAETGADPARSTRGAARSPWAPARRLGRAADDDAAGQVMRDRGIRYGLQTMCEGGGMANATILERIA